GLVGGRGQEQEVVVEGAVRVLVIEDDIEGLIERERVDRAAQFLPYGGKAVGHRDSGIADKEDAPRGIWRRHERAAQTRCFNRAVANLLVEPLKILTAATDRFVDSFLRR